MCDSIVLDCCLQLQDGRLKHGNCDLRVCDSGRTRTQMHVDEDEASGLRCERGPQIWQMQRAHSTLVRAGASSPPPPRAAPVAHECLLV